MKTNIEWRLPKLHAELERAQYSQLQRELNVQQSFKRAGISDDLCYAYEAFCNALDPQFGQRGGFSITCYGDHSGSYTAYDPYFSIFKASVEMSYTDCNFRCEPSTLDHSDGTTEYVVEFWPMKPLGPVGSESTWFDLFVSCTVPGILI